MDFGAVLDAAVSQALGPQAIVFALAAIGLNIHFGYTGLLNFGQAGFMAVAGFALAVSIVKLDLPFFLAIVMGLAVSVVLAFILGVPTLRLRADYLAIVTIATAEILRLILGAVEFKDAFGGSNGLNGFVGAYQDLNPYDSGLDIGIGSWSRNDLWSLTVGWVLVGLGCLLVWALMRSPWGRLLRSIREDEDAVRSLGKNVFAYKMQSLILGGVFGGIAGMFHVLKQGSAVPTDFNTTFTFFAYAALLVGGAARVLGPVAGSMIFWFLVSGLGQLFGQLTSVRAGADTSDLTTIVLIVLGVVLAGGFIAWNHFVRQPRTGQTVGKSRAGITVAEGGVYRVAGFDADRQPADSRSRRSAVLLDVAIPFLLAIPAYLGVLILARDTAVDPILPTWLMTNTQSSLVRFVVLGGGLMLLMIFRPQGIFGDRREIAIDAR
jgi:branched-chain amino acid transport system permease protein